jgi:hypothetical protein
VADGRTASELSALRVELDSAGKFAAFLLETGIADPSAWREYEETGVIHRETWRSIARASAAYGLKTFPVVPAGTRAAASRIVARAAGIRQRLSEDEQELLGEWSDKEGQEWPHREKDVIVLLRALELAEGDLRSELFAAPAASESEEYWSRLEDEVLDMQESADAATQPAAPPSEHHFSRPENNYNMQLGRSRLEALEKLAAMHGTCLLGPSAMVSGMRAAYWMSQMRRRFHAGKIGHETASRLEKLPDWTWDDDLAKDLTLLNEAERQIAVCLDANKAQVLTVARVVEKYASGKLHPDAAARLEAASWVGLMGRPSPSGEGALLLEGVRANFSLSALEEDVIRERILAARTTKYSDLGDRHGVSREAVRQAEQKILAKAAHPATLYRTLGFAEHDPSPDYPQAGGGPVAAASPELEFVAWLSAEWGERAAPARVGGSEAGGEELRMRALAECSREKELSTKEELFFATAAKLGWGLPLSKGRRKQLERAYERLGESQ